LPVEIRLFFKSTVFTSSTFPIQPDFSQNQPVAITVNTGSPRTSLARSLARSLAVAISAASWMLLALL
jgi:hypothetical protein